MRSLTSFLPSLVASAPRAASRKCRAIAMATAIMAFPATAVAQPDDGRQDVLREAVAAYEGKQWSQCRIKALGVFNSKPGPGSAALLGLCEEQLGLYAESAEHLDFHRKNDDGRKPERTKSVEEAWYRVKTKVSIVEVNANTKADIKINGKDAGQTPKTIHAAPGQITIELRAKGFEDTTRTLNGNAGQMQAIQIAMKPGAGSAEGNEKPIWPPILMGGVAAAGIGIGIGLVVVSAGKYSDAEELSGCSPVTQACVTEGDELLSSANGFLGGGIAAFTIGGAAAIGAIVYALLPGASSEKTSLVPILSPTTGGLVITTSF